MRFLHYQNILSDGSKQEFLLQCRKLTYSSIVNRPESSCILILIQGLSSYGRWRRCHEFPLFDIDVLIKKKRLWLVKKVNQNLPRYLFNPTCDA